ncbi:MAG: leucine-rich repeat domain-containing protein, partial [Acholeplasmatales bacterium]|nr:leucine-rich repeat domain-containing protein [Acholeplasmatales bacterium]
TNVVSLLIPDEYTITDDIFVIKDFLNITYEIETDEIEIEDKNEVELEDLVIDKSIDNEQEYIRNFIIEDKKLKEYVGYTENVIIPEGLVTEISSGAFKNSNIVSVTIPQDIKIIRNRCFEGCGKLKEVVMGDGVKTIGSYAFTGCDELKRVKLSNKLTSIGDYAFSRCKNLIEIDFPLSLEKIGDYAFSRCSSLRNIFIPENVSSIDSYTFRDCTAVSKVLVDKNNIYYDSRDNCNAIIEKDNDKLIFACKNATIPEGVKSIGEYAFASLTEFNIVIPASVTNISSEAFFECDKISSISVDFNNKVYDSRENCNGIIETETNTLLFGCSKTIIPDGIAAIERHAFYKCDDLKSITIPASVKRVGANAFESCKNLKEIIICCKRKAFRFIPPGYQEYFYDKNSCPNVVLRWKDVDTNKIL